MKRLSYIFILASLIFSSCQKVFEKPKWQTDIMAPLIKTSLGIENIMADTSMVKADGDTIKIVSREKLYDVNIDSLVKLEVVPFTKNVKLSSLKLDPKTISRKITLGELARAMKANGDATGDYILLFQGSYYAVPPVNNLTAGPILVDVNQFFEEAKMNNPGGTMDIKIDNGLPLNISRAEFELKNKSALITDPAIAHEVFLNLNAGTSQTHTVDLSDQSMEGNLAVKVLDLDLQGGFVQIDTNDAITVTLTIKDISVREATAIFPAQDVVDQKEETSLKGLGDARLRLAKIEAGTVEAEAYSTAEDTVYFTYTIPSATKNGVPFVMNTQIPPANGNNNVHVTFSADFAGYDLDLTGKTGHDTVNTFYNELKGRIQYTGKKVNLSLDDSLQVTVTLKDVKPSYVSGYLGRDTMTTGSESVSFDIFKKLQGTLNFEKVNIALVVENGLGVDGEFVLNNVQAVNTRTGQSQTLTGYTPVGVIAKATDNPYTPAITRIPLSASNAVDLLNILPDRINYNVELRINNSAYTPGVYPDFVYSHSILNPILEIELPLSIYADQLLLSDTADFVSENFKTSVNSGSFSLHMDNGFPLSGDVKMYFLDHNGLAIDSVVAAGSLLPGVLNAQNRVTQSTHSVMSFYLDEHRMQNVLHSRKVVFNVKFSTANAPNYVKIFSDYKIDFKLVGDFNYTIE